MPNSMYFSRWQHIWGSVVFVRKMLDGRTDMSDRDKMAYQLRTRQRSDEALARIISDAAFSSQNKSLEYLRMSLETHNVIVRNLGKMGIVSQ